MLAAIKRRSLWVVVPFFLLLGPFLGMLYINRGATALAYFLIFWLVGVGAKGANIDPDGDVWAIVTLISWVGGLIHGIVIVRGRDPSEPLKWYARWYSAATLVAVILLWEGARYFYYRPFNVPSASMSPTMYLGDRFFADVSREAGSDLQVGDVIVFNAPDGTGAKFVKRVVGRAGDKVQMVNGKLRLNGVDVPHVASGPLILVTEGQEGPDPELGWFVETLPNGHMHAVLDAVKNGPMDNTPEFTVPDGQYFVLGDNRDNSNDSRVSKFGFVTQDRIIGRADYFFWSGNDDWFDFRPVE